MKINLIILTALILLTGLWTIQSNNGKNIQTKTVEQLAPDFSYTTIEGKKSSLYAHEGKIVLLHFWASWCAPCIVEFPSLLELAADQKDNLVILAVSTDEKKSDIRAFLKKLKHGIPENVQIIQDVDKNISQNLYQTLKLPETYVISKNSTIAEKVIGPQENWNSIVWQRAISRPQAE